MVTGNSDPNLSGRFIFEYETTPNFKLETVQKLADIARVQSDFMQHQAGAVRLFGVIAQYLPSLPVDVIFMAALAMLELAIEIMCKKYQVKPE